jgi:uncharacterized lipoprotein YddW (UPF0748 family)
MPLGFLPLVGLLLSCFGPKPAELPPPSPKRELRAVWIATVDNIDWPRRGDYNPASQQQHFRDILDAHRASGLNAVFVQVRDAADAYYARSTEPWSQWLTGRQGRAPEPFYDPLDFMIDESHARGLEFHAWLNLNRATFKGATSIAPDHISRTRPDWMLTYDGMKLFNMGLPDVRDYITGVVVNIVRNYDVDGIHFDDYFYPYHVPGQVLRDGPTFKKYGQDFATIDDWRRNNVDLLIKQISDSIRAVKPYVKFGISPFGVWKNRSDRDPDGSETRGGQTSYYHLYADTRRWAQEGWIDYIAPQVYFNQAHRLVPYQPLVSWWLANCGKRHLYIGQGAYRLGSGDWPNPSELPEQVRFNRRIRGVSGEIFFSSKSLTNNYRGFQDSLRADLYRLPALVPTMPWKDSIPPRAPRRLSAIPGGQAVELLWQAPEPAPDGETARYYAVYRFEAGQPEDLENVAHLLKLLRPDETTFTDDRVRPNQRYVYVVTAFDRLHNESASTARVEVTVE